MKKKKYGLVVGCVVLIVLCAAYVGVEKYMDHSQEKKNQQEEAKKIYMTDFSDVASVSYDNDGNVLSFTKKDNKWSYQGDVKFPVNATRMDSLSSTVKKLSAVRKLSGGDDLPAYGLDTPLRRVTVTGVKGDSQTILIGQKTDGGDYYAAIDGQNVPYLISSSLFDETAYGLEDMMELEQFPMISGTDIETITINTDGVSQHYVKKKLDDKGTIAWYRGSDASEDNKLPDNSALNALSDSLSGLSIKRCENYKVTDGDLAGYGLDKPTAVLTYTYKQDDKDQTFIMDVGKLNGDKTNYYTRTKDSNYVNEIDKASLDKCMTVDTGTAGTTGTAGSAESKEAAGTAETAGSAESKEAVGTAGSAESEGTTGTTGTPESEGTTGTTRTSE